MVQDLHQYSSLRKLGSAFGSRGVQHSAIEGILIAVVDGVQVFVHQHLQSTALLQALPKEKLDKDRNSIFNYKLPPLPLICTDFSSGFFAYP